MIIISLCIALASLAVGGLTIFLSYVNWQILKVSQEILDINIRIYDETVTIRKETVIIREETILIKELSESLLTQTNSMRQTLGEPVADTNSS